MIRAALIAFATLAITNALRAEEPPQPVCFPAKDVRKWLAKDWKDEPVVRGLGLDGQLIEIWSSPNGVTWTEIATASDGTACILRGGTNLEVRRHSDDDQPS